MAQQECLITTQGEKKKAVSYEKKELRGRGRERETASRSTFSFRETRDIWATVCICVCILVCVWACTRYNQLGNVHHVGSPNIELGAEW